MEAATANLKPSKKRQLHEVADGLLKVYRTLARMQYLEHAWIQEGPHDISAVLPACQRLGIHPFIIYLYSILPYVDTHGAREVDFFQGGGFADFRHEGVVEEGRDPMFAGVEEEVMRPWMTPLSRIGNHRTLILYDARRHVIGLFSHVDYGSTDRNLREGVEFHPIEGGEESPGGGGLQHDGDNDKDDDDDDDYEYSDDDDNDGDLQGENIWDEADARPAPAVLRDIVAWYESLTELPGGGETSDPEWFPGLTKPLYLKHGWPGANFDGAAFLVDQARTYAAQSAKRIAETPIQRVSELQGWVQHYSKETPEMQKDKETVTTTTNLEEEWLARWRLWRAECRKTDAKRKLREAKEEAERRCPEGQSQKPDELLLWELWKLQERMHHYQRHLLRLTQEGEKAGGPDRASESLRIRRAFMEKYTTIYQRAYDACKIDAGGRSVPADWGCWEFDSGSARKACNLRDLKLDAEAVRGWLAQVPEGVRQAREAAEELLQRHEKNIASFGK